MKWKHINIEQRKVIKSCISHNKFLFEIGDLISVDPTSISKEVKRNRIKTHNGSTTIECPKTKRWPFVCETCPKRYFTCGYNK